ncbi:proline-rich protein 5-like [Sinocyclocheilus anshuiensis]|uniref:proline-rich protein 5-like n=1 Tax=Sinocyclocheilus anshuiensis TaxID=1608454 RepID=UPI0007B8CADF|nr:PREDICTED: proline-rich protein 5-like [Sinocyclocheilus anshuiensis]
MDRLDLHSAPSTADTILQGPSTALTNNIYAAVIKVFRGEELQPNELYCLNENTRWLLRTDMGFFIRDYLQNQILTKGLSIILDEIQKHEGERQPFVLAQVWDRFFTEILPTLVKPYLWNCRHASCTEQSATRAPVSHPEIRITHHISEGSLLSPVVEHEGEMYFERVGNLRRHSLTNAHSDIKLLPNYGSD